ncbi:MBL fold metallo-hydrolase [Streptomyces sp. NPDC085481]|uniref:MBL fold metallo-hydrolase n=1 Tax=Streptomyces sp. NPDC085481 TaxID=3365727 RepID=UPI0037D943BE
MPLITGTPTPPPPVLPSLRLGRHTVTAIPDGSVQLHPLRWLPESTADDWAGDNASLLDPHGFIEAPIGALLVEYEDSALLIDTGFGPHDIPAADTIDTIGALRGGALPHALRRTGRTLEDIDTVAFTHLHDDHVGWAFRSGPAGRFPFSRATFVASREEWADWTMPPEVSVPARTAGHGEEIFPGVTARLTPGHTRGHTSYVIDTGEHRLIAFGDVFHTPAQFARPDWPVSMDTLPEQAVRTRYELLPELTRPDTLAFGIHFGQGQLGRVVEEDGALRWGPHSEL